MKKKFNSEIERGCIEILRGLFVDRLKEFDDGELDWVYIDIVHDYDTTKVELELCGKKVKMRDIYTGTIMPNITFIVETIMVC